MPSLAVSFKRGHSYNDVVPTRCHIIGGRDMIRIMAKVFAVTVALIVCLSVQPSSAAGVAFVSAAGGGSACTQTAPCSSMNTAIDSLGGAGGRIVCATPVLADAGVGFNESYVFDCPSTIWPNQFTLAGSNVELKFQHMSFSETLSGAPMVRVTGSGTLIFDDCDFERTDGIAIDVEPAGQFNLVIKNSRISNNTGAGVLIKPASGGSVTATFDGVTITNNAGGLRTDTTNGPVTVDISNSTISQNANNGLIALGGAEGNNVVTLKNDVIASNGQAGIEASGANAGVFVNNTLLNSNTGGALSAVSGGRIFTYQNNTVIGSLGSGFSGTAAPQ